MSIKQRLQSGPSLVLGIPTLGRPVPLDWALSLKSLNPPINFNTTFQIVRDKDVASARNQIAEHAVKVDAKYLFFLGDDVVVPPYTLKQLIYRMEQDESIDVIGGVYVSKTSPSAPLVFRGNGEGSYWDWKIGEFFECTGLGMDCTLIRVSAFEKIERPFFKTVDEDRYLDGVNEAVSWTEDLFFLDKLHKAGGRIFCDAAVICEHWDVYSNTKYSLPKDSLPMRQKGVDKNKKALLMNPPFGFNLADESYAVTTFGDEGNDYRGKVNNLPFAGGEFDFIAVFETSWVTLSICLTEWLRVLRVSGKLSISVDRFHNIEPVIEWLVSKGMTPDRNGDFLEITKA